MSMSKLSLRFARLKQLFFSALLFAACAPAAQAASLLAISDAEIELFVDDVLDLVLPSIGHAVTEIDIKTINDLSFNAFVTDHKTIYITSGALIEIDSAADLVALIAHEIGHVAGGHIARIDGNNDVLSAIGAATSLIGIVATAVETVRGGGDDESAHVASGLATAGLIGPDLVRRLGLSYQRSEELAADQASITYLQRSGLKPDPIINLLEKISPSADLAVYDSTHPGARNRIRAARRRIDALGDARGEDINPEFERRLRRIQAKLAGYLLEPDDVANRFNGDAIEDAYAHAIAEFREGGYAAAEKKLKAMLEREPDNPFFLELLGQSLLEDGQPRLALDPLARAIDHHGHQATLSLYAHALVLVGGRENWERVVRMLEAAFATDEPQGDALRHLATAYAELQRYPEADLTLARRYLLYGDTARAAAFAKRASEAAEPDSRVALLAEDILESID